MRLPKSSAQRASINMQISRFGAFILLAVLILGGHVSTTRIVGDSSDDQGIRQGMASLVEEMTIGATDGPEEYLFSSIQNILVAKDSTVWVLDGRILNGTPWLRQYDVEGNYLRHVGRQGGGPGEYQYPFGLAQLLDGRVLLRHGGAMNRINVYLPDGTPDTTWTFRTPVPLTHGFEHTIHVDMSDHVWLLFSNWDSRGRLAYLRLRTDGSVIDTVQTPNLPSVDRAGVTSTYGFSVPYQPVNIVSWSPRGFCATAQTGKYEIALYEPTRIPGREEDRPPRWFPGDPVVTVSRTVEPVEVSRAEREDQRSYLLAQVRLRNQSYSGSIPDIPRQKPPIRGVLFGDDGRIWVWVSMPSQQYEPQSDQTRAGPPSPVLNWREPIAFDVFEPDGVFIGRVVLPYGIFPYQPTTCMKGDLIWSVVRDEEGVEVIRRYRVYWP